MSQIELQEELSIYQQLLAEFRDASEGLARYLDNEAYNELVEDPDVIDEQFIFNAAVSFLLNELQSIGIEFYDLENLVLDLRAVKTLPTLLQAFSREKFTEWYSNASEELQHRVGSVIDAVSNEHEVEACVEELFTILLSSPRIALSKLNIVKNNIELTFSNQRFVDRMGALVEELNETINEPTPTSNMLLLRTVYAKHVADERRVFEAAVNQLLVITADRTSPAYSPTAVDKAKLNNRVKRYHRDLLSPDVIDVNAMLFNDDPDVDFADHAVTSRHHAEFFTENKVDPTIEDMITIVAANFIPGTPVASLISKLQPKLMSSGLLPEQITAILRLTKALTYVTGL